jgi:hypothetical protein
MSARFGHDFSHVRIHDSSVADEAARSVGARAFTLGSDIHFAAGEYSRGSRNSERLLAHELTHVVQQDRAGLAAGQLKSRRSDPAEREAERAADQILSGRAAKIESAPQAAISCFDPGYNDVQNDFWNTKSTFGKGAGSVVDSAMNTFWDVAGMTPVGGVLSEVADLGKAGYSEGMSTLYGWEGQLSGNQADNMRSKQYDEAASSFMGDAAVDATGLIPGYGTYQGAMSAGYDATRTGALAAGADPDSIPSAGDLQKKAGAGLYGLVNPATPAPAPDPNAAPDPNTPPPYINPNQDPFGGM